MRFCIIPLRFEQTAISTSSIMPLANGRCERIQSPSDMVHGLGVGAFSLMPHPPVHAAYSCIGPGRECGKVKPDLVAFGGCENTPIHLSLTIPGQKALWWGTSFAFTACIQVGMPKQLTPLSRSSCFVRSGFMGPYGRVSWKSNRLAEIRQSAGAWPFA